MLLSLTKRMFTEVDLRLLMKFGYNMGWKGLRGISKFKKRLKRNELFPAFLMISVTNQCNFTCQGCWVSIDNSSPGMNPEVLDNIIKSSKKKGSYFFGLLGGEPFMYPYILDILEHCDIRIRDESKFRDKLKLQKKGLMHDLLTGKVRIKV